MRRIHCLALAAGALLVAAPVGATQASRPSTTPVDGSAKAAWVEFAARAAGGAPTAPVDPNAMISPDGSYSVVFPSPPTESQQSAPLPDGSTVPIELLQLQSPEALYQTAYALYPDSVTTDLDTEIDSFVQSAQAELVSSEPIERAGRQGRLFVATQTAGSATVVGMAFVQGQAVWLVATARPGDITPQDPEVASFLDSFQFTEGG